MVIVVEKFQNREICDYCSSLLLYDKEDMLRDEENWRYIICPVCGRRLYV
jgi:RNase P subunit RPR2